VGVQVGLRSRDGKFRDCAAAAPSCESSRGEPDTDLAVGARSSDDLLPGERGRRVVAQAHRRRGLDELRTVGPDIELASRERVPGALTARIAEAGLEPAPGDKTRICCQDGRRRGQHPHTSFTFLGFEFRQRRVRTRSAEMCSGFNPATSKAAPKKRRR
jgi:hypothetical protein